MTFDRLLGRERRRLRASTRLAGGFAGVAAGVGLMYFLDPRGGARRRSLFARRAERALHEVEGTVGAGARDLSHRARGLAHEAKVRVEGEEVSDEVLAERVRAKLGRLTSHPRAIEVAVRGGRVELAGPVFRAEHDRLLRGVRWVRGVRGVDDRLESRDGAEGVPALQGAGPLRGPRAAPVPRTFGPGLKLLAGAAGAILAGRALLGAGVGRVLAGVAGAAMLGKALGESGPSAREARRLAREAGALARREGEQEAEREEHRGGWHPGPEVREVKSPAELDPGIASASPQPTSGSKRRADGGARGRSDGGGRPEGGGRRKASEEERTAGAGAGEVSPPGYSAPPLGSGVRESDLGAVGAEPEERERGGGAEPGASRRDPGDEG